MATHDGGARCHAYVSPDNELNNYEDDEDFEDDGSNASDSMNDTSRDCDSDSVDLETELARAVFAGLATTNGCLEEEKLLDMFQRRLFSSPTTAMSNSSRLQAKGRATASKVNSTAGLRSCAQGWLDRSDSQGARIFSLVPAPADASTISPEKIGKMVHRFRLQDERRALKLRAKREAAEHAGFTYTPALNRKSLQMTHAMPAFLDRQKKHLAHQQQQREWHKQAQEQELRRDRTLDLEARVKTPCICSRGSATGATSDCAPPAAAPKTSPSRLGGHNPAPLSAATGGQTHTRACLRFMEMCTTMNTSFAIQRRKDQMRRSIDDMMAFHEAKKQRQRARREIARAQEAMETTFAPQINARSAQIYAEMVRTGRLQPTLSDRTSTQPAALAIPPRSFRSLISKKSVALLLRKKKHERLQASASVSSSSAAAGGTDADEAGANDGEGDVFVRLHSQQLPRGVSVAAAKPRKTTTQAAAEWNEIAYNDSKHGFILRNFDMKLLGA